MAKNRALRDAVKDPVAKNAKNVVSEEGTARNPWCNMLRIMGTFLVGVAVGVVSVRLLKPWT
jgi:hypothetical protein